MSKSTSSLLQNTFVVFASCMFIGVLMRDPTTVVTALWDSTYGISIFVLLLYYKRVLKFAFRDGFLWVLHVIAFLSTFWSVAPELSLRRSIALLAATIFGIYLGICYSPSKLSQLLRWTLAFVAVLSLALAILVPSYAFMDDLNGRGLRLMGALGHPNQLGRVMVLSIVMWLNYLFSFRSLYRRLLCIGMISLSIVPLLLTRSVGSLTSCILLIATLFLLRVINRFGKLAIAALLFLFPVGCGAAYEIANNSELLLNSVGRDDSLTGRGPLWESVWQMIQQKPWFGYGLDAFWTTGWNGPAAEVWATVGWEAPYAHNGFLDLWLHLGVFGLIAFLLSILRNVQKIITNFGTQDEPESILPALFIAFAIFSNLSEGNLVSPSYFWVLYVFSSTNLSLRAGTRKQRIQNSIKREVYTTL